MQELAALNSYIFTTPLLSADILGAWADGSVSWLDSLLYGKGHSDFPGQTPNGPFDYTQEDKGDTSPYNPTATWLHFRPLSDSERELTKDVKSCKKKDFESHAHQMQDFFAHYGQGFRAEHYHLSWWQSLAYLAISAQPSVPVVIRIDHWEQIKNYPFGHAVATAKGFTYLFALPDSSVDYAAAFGQAVERTKMWYEQWNKCCCMEGDTWSQRKDTSGKSVCADFTQPDNPYGETADPPQLRRLEILFDQLYPSLKPHQMNPSVLKANKLGSMNL